MNPDEFEDFEGMSKKDFQDWLFNHRKVLSEFMYDIGYDEDDSLVQYINGIFSITLIEGSPQKFAEHVKGWQLFTN
jgi:hypothetical protein